MITRPMWSILDSQEAVNLIFYLKTLLVHPMHQPGIRLSCFWKTREERLRRYD